MNMAVDFSTPYRQEFPCLSKNYAFICYGGWKLFLYMQYLFVRDIGFATGWEMRKDVERYSVEFEAPGVEVHCLHGYGVDTLNR